MAQVKMKESVLQKDCRIRLPKEITQFGYVPGEDFFDIVLNSQGDILLKKSNSGRVNNYGKNK